MYGHQFSRRSMAGYPKRYLSETCRALFHSARARGPVVAFGQPSWLTIRFYSKKFATVEARHRDTRNGKRLCEKKDLCMYTFGSARRGIRRAWRKGWRSVRRCAPCSRCASAPAPGCTCTGTSPASPGRIPDNITINSLPHVIIVI